MGVVVDEFKDHVIDLVIAEEQLQNHLPQLVGEVLVAIKMRFNVGLVDFLELVGKIKTEDILTNSSMN